MIAIGVGNRLSLPSWADEIPTNTTARGSTKASPNTPPTSGAASAVPTLLRIRVYGLTGPAAGRGTRRGMAASPIARSPAAMPRTAGARVSQTRPNHSNIESGPGVGSVNEYDNTRTVSRNAGAIPRNTPTVISPTPAWSMALRPSVRRLTQPASNQPAQAPSRAPTNAPSRS